MGWIAGVDGFKSRWIVVLENPGSGEVRSRVCERFADLLSLPEEPIVLTVDIPIGLPDVTLTGGRQCEKLARKMLQAKASSVFSAVGRSTLKCASRQESDRFSRDHGGVGVGAQAWGLATKLRDGDAVMTAEHQSRVYEVHPEVCFYVMNGNQPVYSRKKTPVGALDRERLLNENGIEIDLIVRNSASLKVPIDDLQDACAALWTARRILKSDAQRLPGSLDRDARGLDQAIWY